MQFSLNTLILIHVALFGACALYAYILQHNPGYAPDWTWATVVGGAALILLALGATCAAGFLPWDALRIGFTLCCAAGAPIIYWQRKQARARAAERERDKHRER